MMRMRSQKIKTLMLGKTELSRERITVFFHRDILGAHRYTTRGGMCVLRRPLHGAVVCRGQPKREVTLPLRCVRHTYPFVNFASDDTLKDRASPSTKSKGGFPRVSCASQRQEVMLLWSKT